MTERMERFKKMFQAILEEYTITVSKMDQLICNDLLSRVNCRKSPQTFI